jgi:hypothetical protein
VANDPALSVAFAGARVARRTFLGNLRLALLLAVLAFVALGAWLERARSRDWDNPLRVTVYPLPANDDGPALATYARSLQAEDFAAVGEFLASEGARHGLAIDTPVRIRVSHAATERPPRLSERPNLLSVMAWSLRLRWYALRVSWDDPLPTPDVQVFTMFAPVDVEGAAALPDSVGLSKGLIAVAHLYASREAAGSNQVVVAHELLHTLGATDKYDPGTGRPLVPVGLGEPDRDPTYPQAYAEIMAGRIALAPGDAVMPASLDDVVVGALTAREIGWTK